MGADVDPLILYLDPSNECFGLVDVDFRTSRARNTSGLPASSLL